MYLDEYANKIYNNALKLALSDKDKYVRVCHLICSILNDADNNPIYFILEDLGVNINDFNVDLNFIRISKTQTTNEGICLTSDELTVVLELDAQAVWNINEIFSRLLYTQNECAELFKKYNITNKNFNKMLIDTISKDNNDNLVHANNNVVKTKQSFLVNLNDKIKNDNHVYFYNEEKLSELYTVLNRKKKSNPLLIGKAGTGKTSFVESFVKKINSKTVPLLLEEKTIYSLDLNDLISGTTYRGDFENKMKKLITEITQKNCILYIDEIHNIIGSGGDVMDFGNILKPYLASGEISVIGSTTFEEYHKYIEKNKALNRRFQTIIIDEPNLLETVEILKTVKGDYEKHHNVRYSEEVIEKIVHYSDKFINTTAQPDKAIQLLDDLGAYVTSTIFKTELKYDVELTEIEKEILTIVESGDYTNYVEVKKKKQSVEVKKQKKYPTKKIDVGTLDVFFERKHKIQPQKQINYTELFTKINKTIIGQNNAVVDVLTYMKLRDFSNESNCDVLLFCGGSGVGKTLLAKNIADEFYHGKINRIDCGNFKEAYTVSNLLGSPNGYVDSNVEPEWLTFIKNNPNSILIIDEIEKAHPNIFDIFLTIFDEGYLKIKNGEVIDFRQVLIVITTNISGSNNIGFGENKNGVEVELNKFFRKEFINRIDKIVTFDVLSKDSVVKIIENYIFDNSEKLKSVGLTINAPEHINNIDYEKYGVRAIHRYLKTLIENQIKKEFNLT
jgi:ATP-dependent Clp protease ATP-binding subunit ClpA